LTNLLRTDNLPPSSLPRVKTIILPTLIRLLSENLAESDEPHAKTSGGLVSASSSVASVLERAPSILSYLIIDSEEMQQAAMEGGAIQKLAVFIQPKKRGAEPTPMKGLEGVLQIPAQKPTGYPPKIREGALLGISAICSLKEDCRKQVIDSKLLPHIVEAMTDPIPQIRAAACQCTRSLSRSVKNLRTSLVDGGVAIPLIQLLSDPNVQVQTTASATLCNIVLDF
ncbi:Armadillo repeat-containing protein 8, partial [Dinochytrium kinnereticum]